MNLKDLSKREKVEAALNLVPPLMRKTLLNDLSFTKMYDLEIENVISLGNGDANFDGGKFFDSIRKVIEGESEIKLIDTIGQEWTATIIPGDNGLPCPVIASNNYKIRLPNTILLAADASTRLNYLDYISNDLNLTYSSYQQWKVILQERAISEIEIDYFQSNIRDTPSFVERTIFDEFESGECAVSTMVPNSLRYFERLVGVYDGSDCIQNYAIALSQDFFKEINKWSPYQGFFSSLLLSSHSSLTDQIVLDLLDYEGVRDAYASLTKTADVLSKLGAIEVGLRILSDRPEIESFLLQLITQIKDDDLKSGSSGFNLFSALFVLVDGELARNRALAEKPPFYRRLASMAQASLIQRQVIKSGIDSNHFAIWANKNGVQNFYMQTLVDMRQEPRWSPDFVSPAQLKADFLGRIMILGYKLEERLPRGEFHNIVLGDYEYSINKQVEFPRPFFPGPLEGGEESQNFLPDYYVSFIQKQLNSEDVEAASFIALVNSAMIFKVTPNQADMAVNALKLANHTLAKLENKAMLLGILNGLATLSAVSRNFKLAQEIRIISRRYLRDTEFPLTIEQVMRICLVASASKVDLEEWRTFAGEWLCELAFSDLNEQNASNLHSHLLTLLHSAPELWVTCAKADAALEAWCLR